MYSEINDRVMKNLSDAVCYMHAHHMHDVSWTAAVDAFKEITMETCRSVSKQYIDDMLDGR